MSLPLLLGLAMRSCLSERRCYLIIPFAPRMFTEHLKCAMQSTQQTLSMCIHGAGHGVVGSRHCAITWWNSKMLSNIILSESLLEVVTFANWMTNVEVSEDGRWGKYPESMRLGKGNKPTERICYLQRIFKKCEWCMETVRPEEK